MLELNILISLVHFGFGISQAVNDRIVGEFLGDIGITVGGVFFSITEATIV